MVLVCDLYSHGVSFVKGYDVGSRVINEVVPSFLFRGIVDVQIAIRVLVAEARMSFGSITKFG